MDLSLPFPEGEDKKDKSAAFSISTLLLLMFRFLKLNLGIRFFRLLGLFLGEEEEGLRDAPRCPIRGLDIGEKLTLLATGLDVKDAFRVNRSSLVSSGVLDGKSNTMPRLHRSRPGDSSSSSAISAESPSCKDQERSFSNPISFFSGSIKTKGPIFDK